MRLYLGTHMVGWLAGSAVPLFVSRRRLTTRKRLPVATAPWALDSGGFTELTMFGEWRTTIDEYAADVERFARDVGLLDWVAPMDWMCEPHILANTDLTVSEHQARTVDNFVRLRERLGRLVVPVIQGWTVDDYLRCWERYERVGVNLDREETIGVGTVCRRQNTAEAGLIVRTLAVHLPAVALHGFGVKTVGLESFGDALRSADSMAWSYGARNAPPLPGCTHKSCANCPRYALRWRAQLLARLGQQRIEVAA